MRNLQTYEDFLFEFISYKQLDSVEIYADKLFKLIGVDIEFTKHFFDRVNDSRNGKPITVEELKDLFKRTYEQYRDKISTMQDEVEAVLFDMRSDINIPFVININKGELDLVTKTVMRKHDFKTYTKKLPIK
jgi:hypothetical protein